MQNIAVIRRVNGLLAWYPPGSSDGARVLDTESEQEALRLAIGERQIRPVFAVPGDQARLLRLSVTTEERRHLGKSLPFMLEEELATDVAELHFAAQALDKLDYAVAVCALQDMASYDEQLSHYPDIRQWLPEPLLLPWQEGEWCLVLEGEWAIVRTGRCEGFSIEREMLTALLQAALGDSAGPETIIVYGREQVQDTALIPDTLRGRVQWRAGDFYAAMLIAPEPNPALNLRQGAFARRLPLRRWWGQWRSAAMLFGLAFAAHLLFTYLDYHQLQQQNITLRTAVHESYRKAYPKGAVVDAEKQLKRQLAGLSGTSQGSGFVRLMEQVGAVITASKGTSIVSINYSDKAHEIRLNIVASDYGAVERVRAGIVEAGLQAVMESSSAQGGKVRARLRVEGDS